MYETSLYLSVIFNSPRQTTSIVSHIIPGMYLNCPPPHPNRLLTVLISLLHHLVASYPSQSTYEQYLDTIPSSFLPKASEPRRWIDSVARSLRTRNIIKFDRLTDMTALLPLFQPLEAGENASKLPPPTMKATTLAQKALCCLVDSLRQCAQETAWDVIRAAYREFACQQGSDITRDWLERSLCLKSVSSLGVSVALDEWLEKRASVGQVRPKEGVEGRWIVCKVR